MQHHEPDISPQMQQLLDDQMSKQLNAMMKQEAASQGFGATGKFPDGKLTENDEGELFFGVTAYHGQVILNFGKPVQSCGFSPTQARELALALRKRANEIERNPDL